MQFQEILRNSALLASLTQGGHLPFRRLCVDFGAEITISEMLFARSLLKGNKRERALLKSHESERYFGAQIATKDPSEAVEAAKAAVEAGAKFIDFNCACPIEEATRRGLCAALLQKPKRIADILSSLTGALDVPVTVKVRLGWNDESINYLQIAHLAAESGVAAIVIHGRTRQQRYTRAADWEKIADGAKGLSIPVVGNGDILTHFEARARRASAGVASVMIARGALIKPWLFRELREGRTWDPSPAERIEVYFRLAGYMKDHFGDDEFGRKRIMNFLPWHFDFFHRYRYLPESRFGTMAATHPLIQTRDDNEMPADPLERLLRSSEEERHKQFAEILIDSQSEAEAKERFSSLAMAAA